MNTLYKHTRTSAPALVAHDFACILFAFKDYTYTNLIYEGSFVLSIPQLTPLVTPFIWSHVTIMAVIWYTNFLNTETFQSCRMAKDLYEMNAYRTHNTIFSKCKQEFSQRIICCLFRIFSALLAIEQSLFSVCVRFFLCSKI